MSDIDPSTESSVAGGSTGNKQKRVVLQPFEELVGRLERLEQSDATLIIELDVATLQYPLASREATICNAQLEGWENEKISILRTRSSETPLLIRTPKSDG